jgi:hypothetical protein
MGNSPSSNDKQKPSNVINMDPGSNLNIKCGSPSATPQQNGTVKNATPPTVTASVQKEPFVSIGPDGRVYTKLPPCPDGGPLTATTVPMIAQYRKNCPYYWECRPNVSCPKEFEKAFYTAEGKFQIYV